MFAQPIPDIINQLQGKLQDNFPDIIQVQIRRDISQHIHGSIFGEDLADIGVIFDEMS